MEEEDLRTLNELLKGCLQDADLHLASRGEAL